MLDRVAVGSLPPKHHTALYRADGKLAYEECFTRAGFDGPYTILYHAQRPQALESRATTRRCLAPESSKESSPLRRRHFRSTDLLRATVAIDGRIPLLFNEDLLLSVVCATDSDDAYFVNADADELFFVKAGAGAVISLFGELAFAPGDYLCLPKGTLYRFVLGEGACEMLLVESRGALGLPRQWRNEVGQLRMDAPYCHRDFRRPRFVGPQDEGLRDLVVKRAARYHGFRYAHSPLDVLGWDGTVYPFAFPILAFQPRVSSVHLPPTWHGTFAARGALICSFVPRPLDFHPDAVPCPYPHSSVDMDEVIYYVSGDFSSRTGVASGSLTLHPRGIPHGPQPGRYEASLGKTRTEELAVMIDSALPLTPTTFAGSIEDDGYDASFSLSGS